MDVSQLVADITNYTYKLAGDNLPGALVGVFAGAAGGYALSTYRNFRKQQTARKAIRENRLDGLKAIFGETLYAPSSALNPLTSEQYYDQRIRNYGSIDIGDIFHEHVKEKILPYIEKAKGFCTDDQPVVFSHLAKVVPKRQLDNTKKMISKQWVNFFGGKLTDTRLILKNNQRPDKILKEITKIPVLVYEKGAEQKQYRVLLMSEFQLASGNYPKFENVRFPSDRGCVHDEDHVHALRYKTNLAIAKTLSQDDWLRFGFSVSVPTGEIESHI